MEEEKFAGGNDIDLKLYKVKIREGGGVGGAGKMNPAQKSKTQNNNDRMLKTY